MKNKNFLNKINDLKPKAPVPIEVERKLLPRLKFMGYVLFVLCLISFLYAIIAKEETETAKEKEGFVDPEQTEAVSGFEILLEDELEFSPNEVLNFYLVSFIFAFVGAACFLIVWKKKKTLFQDPHIGKE